MCNGAEGGNSLNHKGLSRLVRVCGTEEKKQWERTSGFNSQTDELVDGPGGAGFHHRAAFLSRGSTRGGVPADAGPELRRSRNFSYDPKLEKLVVEGLDVDLNRGTTISWS